MPNIVEDKQNTLHVVYGSGDSIMYTSLNTGDTFFSAPVVIDVLPHLMAAFTRGPQIACSDKGLTVTACTRDGDIFSYNKTGSARWIKTARVNDVDTVAKENFMSLGGDGQYNYAVWLDLRADKRNKIYGARSDDGGKTWSANQLVYASPDSTVCSCCKPSVVVKGDKVYVMFRNWLNRNRDLYLIQSNDGGKTFGNAEKIGIGNWKLNACPMDGGGMAINTNGLVQTVWRREGKIYAAQPGLTEKEIGEGKACNVALLKDQPVYAWIKDGFVTVSTTGKREMILGKGNLPVLRALSDKTMICVWENEQQIHAAIFII